MKKSSLDQALRASLVIAISAVIAGSAYFFFQSGVNYVFVLLLIFIVSWIIGLIAIRYVIDKYIGTHIKQIYKTIFKTQRGDPHQIAVMDGTVHLQDLNKEVQDWVNSKSAEIEHLKKLEKYRRDFVGNVSHELKTPIFNVQGYVLTLLDGGLEDETINRKYLLRTEKSIERLINIVTDLETIYKLESDKLVLKQERFDIVPVIRDALETLDSKAKKRGNTLKMNISPEKTVIVYADPGRISQVILNLVANSIAYGNENGVTQIGFFDLDDNILIEVTDNGIGISETEIPRIFERFYRTDSSRSRKSGGTGIGLAIVKHILEAHNQTINVRSELGEGSTFSFMLPKNQKS